MTRERWLALAGCLTLLCSLPACGNLCLNPQPEPPGSGGCGNAESMVARDSGYAAIGDARTAAEAGSGRSEDAGRDTPSPPTLIDGGADRQPDRADAASDGASEAAAPEASSDSNDGTTSDALGDGAEDVLDAAAGDTSSDVPNDGADVASREASSDAEDAMRR